MKSPNYELVYTETKFDEIEFPVSEVEYLTIGGDKTFAAFKYNSGGQYSQTPKAKQILYRYFEKIKSLRGHTFFKGEDVATFNVVSNEKEYWCVIQVYDEGASYTLSVLEKKDFQGAKDSQSLLDKLTSSGEVDLYISFSSGSANLSESSQQIIEEVAKFMRKVPKLSISIEGHTDNVGDHQDNMTLSEERAKSVKRALVLQGVDPSRMQTKGWGDTHPVAPNDTKEGRLKNRRVSLIKIN
ncbi:OmpA family protein [Sediminitomix flava]|nr:OmpA family protein [Sediminitomix flava]